LIAATYNVSLFLFWFSLFKNKGAMSQNDQHEHGKDAEVCIVVPRHDDDDDADDVKPTTRLSSSSLASSVTLARVVEGAKILCKQGAWLVINMISLSISLTVSLVVFGLIAFTLYELLRGGGSS
jgi:hypothetical protein